jgi:hypothetical protein
MKDLVLRTRGAEQPFALDFGFAVPRQSTSP